MPSKSAADDQGRDRTGGDAGEAEVQRKADEAEQKGYIGTVPPGPPNEAYSLESGPDAPSHAEERSYTREETK